MQPPSQASRKRLLIKCLRILWIIVAWLGVCLGLLGLLLIVIRALGADGVLPDTADEDLLASAGFFALIVGLCIWLIVYGRRFFDRFKS